MRKITIILWCICFLQSKQYAQSKYVWDLQIRTIFEKNIPFKVIDSFYWKKINDKDIEQIIVPKRVYFKMLDTFANIRKIEIDINGVVKWTDYFKDSTPEVKFINKHPKKEDRFTEKHYVEYMVANKPFERFKAVIRGGYLLLSVRKKF